MKRSTDAQRSSHGCKSSNVKKRGARIASISGGKMVFPPNFFGTYEEKR